MLLGDVMGTEILIWTLWSKAGIEFEQYSLSCFRGKTVDFEVIQYKQ
jgi:hypothetical protein